MEKLNQYAPLVLVLMGLLILFLGASFFKNIIAIVFLAVGGYFLYLRSKK